jgi:hypothetical protein
LPLKFISIMALCIKMQKQIIVERIKHAKFHVDTSGSASIASSNPDVMAAIISLDDILNSVSPNPSKYTFEGTHATIAAGIGAVGFPKSEINSNNLAPIELTYERERG